MPRTENIRMLTNKTPNTVNADIIIPINLLGSNCFFSITKKEKERIAVLEIEDIKPALEIILGAIDSFGKTTCKFSTNATGTMTTIRQRMKTGEYSDIIADKGPVCLSFNPGPRVFK
ncbi:MAG TPA: hypothetical protein VJR67_01255 [Candidatus Nitrosopolaris sp.]|nr:hypothetical protein [Candidatus Nitrosopolaris sp.]